MRRQSSAALLCYTALPLALALRGPYAGQPWHACYNPTSQFVGFDHDREAFTAALLAAMRRAPVVGFDALGAFKYS